MPDENIRSLVVDTDVLICSVRNDEAPERRRRSKDLKDAMFRRRVKWVECDALEKQLKKKVADLLTPNQEKMFVSWEAVMRSRGLYSLIKGEVDSDLRARIRQGHGEREHDIHLVEAALASGRCVCSGDNSACLPLCAVASEVPELQTICWLCLDDKRLSPANALECKLSDPQLERRKLSLGHPFNLEVAGRGRGDSL